MQVDENLQELAAELSGLPLGEAMVLKHRVERCALDVLLPCVHPRVDTAANPKRRDVLGDRGVRELAKQRAFALEAFEHFDRRH